MKDFFSISQTAKIVGITAETLRHYDRIGLVKPGKVDEWTGYRYYSRQEIVKLNTIRALRCMDLTLSEIKDLLSYDDFHKITEALKQAEKSADEKIAELNYAKEKLKFDAEWKQKASWYRKEGMSERDIDEMYRSLSRAVQLNKSLLLLSRIHNGQFPDATDITLNQEAHHIVDMLSEIYANKNIQFIWDEKAPCEVRMHESLAHILINNLIKNAIVHSPEHSTVTLRLDKEYMEISNDGTQSLDESKMFSRFYKADSQYKDSIGLGLSIIHSISEYYHIILSYHFDGRHHFMLKFPKTQN